MNIYETHIAELYRAQEDFNIGAAKVHEVYADAVQRSRERLLAALTAPVGTGGGGGEAPVDMDKLAADIAEAPDGAGMTRAEEFAWVFVDFSRQVLHLDVRGNEREQEERLSRIFSPMKSYAAFLRNAIESAQEPLP